MQREAMSIVTDIIDMPGQKAVYWAPGSKTTGGRDFDDYGQPMYSAPVEIKCRWSDVAEEYVAADGTRQVSHSKVIVDRDVSLGGMLLLGELADVGDVNNPKNNDGAWEIRRFDKVPWLEGDEFLRTSYL